VSELIGETIAACGAEPLTEIGVVGEFTERTG
jgi:hypothetical protein